MIRKNLTALFRLGHTVATPGAVDLLDRTETDSAGLLRRHQCGDWGVVSSQDAASNSQAIVNGTRILSAYELGANRERLWIITEADRQATTLLLPAEY
ncbi:hypothetical protein [Paraburkholderia dilworthii]|uniref:hypothetical protein n=1 Tax=Paraburkholderia dilworthii TaxID=948106 RepID=UPI0004838E69|nr:hypothetical protein [Paraburkholderia dilworthii]